MKPPRLPADDDPAFQRWMSAFDESPQLPRWVVDLPVVAALVLMSAIAFVAVALGWTVWAYAASIGVRSIAVLVLMIIGTGLVLVGSVGLLVGGWWRRQQ